MTGVLNLYASHPHYLDHLAPIWLALPAERRGLAFVASKATGLHAQQLGVHCVPGVFQDYPYGRHTQVQGRQPPVLVAGWRDHRHTGRARTVYLEHGAGQHYVDDDHTGQAAAPRRSRVALFLMPGRYSADLVRAAYPRTPVAEVGCPKLDPWLASTGPDPAAPPTVAITWHWNPDRCCPERRPALPHWEAALPALVARLRQLGVRVYGHSHPRGWRQAGPLYKALGVPTLPTLGQVFDQAHLLVADNTSAAYEFAALGRPVVLLNAPWYRRDVEHGLRFWRLAGIGPQVGTGSHTELAAAITQQLATDPWADRRRRTLAQVYATVEPGQAARTAEMLTKLPV